MKNLNRLLLPSLSVAAVLSILSQRGAGQGPLTPPGSPAPTMKTLAQVEARIPIPGGVSYTISSPGSYYLTGNIAGTGSGNTLTIAASQVTLDLNGYSVISGTGGTCIRIQSGTAIEVTNGSTQGGSYGILINGSTTLSGGVRVDRMRVTDATFAGIEVSSASHGILISDCIITNTGSSSSNGLTAGVYGFSGVTVENCVIDTVVSADATASFGLNLSSGSLAIGNKIFSASTGIKFGKARDNSTINCTTPFSSITDAGGNN